MSSAFVHLRLHTDYSLVDGTIGIKPRTRIIHEPGLDPPFREEEVPGLAEAVKAKAMPAVAVTDHCNLFALVKFYRAALAAGIKPIVGVDLWVRQDAEWTQPGRMALLCQDHAGYLNLTRLISRAYIERRQHGHATIERSWLQGATQGLIALSGARQGDIGQALLGERRDEAARLLDAWRELFPDRFYIELQRTGRAREEDYLHEAVDLATRHAVPVVATNDVCFLEAGDYEAHEARVCIAEGRALADTRRQRHYSEQQYLRSPAEMSALFSDIPEAIENSVEIARRCNLELRLGENVLPEFPLPEGMTTESWFLAQAREGLERRFTRLGIDDAERRRVYAGRLEHEVDVISKMGFPGYFLIVADFIRWARENGVPVGPGRGSGAGSLVAYALEITDLDPLAYDLLFERFLNPERVSLPDFDIDFCMEGRDRVIDYVARRYGRERVSQIITYGSMAAKAVVRDVGRVLGHPYGFVDRIAKLIPFELGMTLSKELKAKGALSERYAEDEELRILIDLASRLEGLVRNAGKHAGGVVIAPSDLTDFTPLYCEQGSDSPVTQFDKDDVEAVGLVKFDFLGLRTLTIIDRTVKAINALGPDVDIGALPMDDAATFELLRRCATTAIFQLESRGMKDLIKRLQPDCFDDIIALVALFRPGPLQSGMVDDFIARKHGAAVTYPHPDIEPILKPTYGVILYQEQVMQIAQVLAGYSLGQADLLRRAMGKKKPEEMAKQREVFMQGASGRGVDAGTARAIFDLMEKFAGYGFNKSHSAAYALLSYQTAWLKAHHPAAFMASVLSADMDNTDKVVTLMDECRAMELAILPPDINRCGYAFAVDAGNDHAILYGLGAIKGVGAAALEGIVAEREAGGPYADLFDLCRRIDLRRANRRVLEALIRSGACDVLDANRARSMGLLGEALLLAERSLRDAAVGQDDLFGSPAAGPAAETLHLEALLRSDVPEWSEEQRLLGEKETLGLYLTGHPVERYLDELGRFVSGNIAELRPNPDQTVLAAGLVIAIRTMNSRRGERIAFITLDDRSARIEIAVFAEAYQRYRDLLAKDRLLVVEGTVSTDDYTGGCRMSAERIYSIDEARAVYARGLEIDIRPGTAPGLSRSLADILEPFRAGICPVWINYQGSSARARMSLGKEWKVNPTDELISRLAEVAGMKGVRVIY